MVQAGKILPSGRQNLILDGTKRKDSTIQGKKVDSGWHKKKRLYHSREESRFWMAQKEKIVPFKGRKLILDGTKRKDSTIQDKKIYLDGTKGNNSTIQDKKIYFGWHKKK